MSATKEDLALAFEAAAKSLRGIPETVTNERREGAEEAFRIVEDLCNNPSIARVVPVQFFGMLRSAASQYLNKFTGGY